MDSMWQTDWYRFATVLGERLCEGASSDDLSRAFQSKRVQWSGVLQEKLLDELAPLVTIDLPKVTVDLGNSDAVSLGDQSIAVSRDAIAAWEGIPLGTPLTFSALIGTDRSPFPAIQVTRLTSGRIIVMIQLSDARPIGDWRASSS